MHLTRGRVTGSNAARECDIGVVAMSIFTTLSNYVLKTCVATGAQEIAADRIWRRGRPKMMLGRFEDEAIDAQYRRQYVDELYQAVMRGIVRMDTSAHYRVWVFLPALWMALELERLLPQYSLLGIGNTPLSRQFNGFSYLRNKGLAGVGSYSQLAGIMGCNSGECRNQGGDEEVAGDLGRSWLKD